MKSTLRNIFILFLLTTNIVQAWGAEERDINEHPREQDINLIVNLSNPTDLRGIVKQYIHANFPHSALLSLARNSRPEPPKPGALETAFKKKFFIAF